MRKNLHYKVLASVLAIAGLYFYNAPAAWADIQEVGNNFWVGNVTITKNIEQESKKEIPQDASVFGERNNDSNKEANNNNVTINDSTLLSVFGGLSDFGESNGNTVTINNSTVSGVSGGRSMTNKADNNTVYIINSTVTQYVYGGNTDRGTANHNEIIIRGNSNVRNAYLYGGSANGTGNKLTLDGWSGSVNSVNNFSDIYINNFTLNTNLINVGSVSGMDDVTIHLGAFTATKDDFKINAGDYAEKSNVKTSKIEWDEDIKGSVVFTDKDGNDVTDFDDSLFAAGSLANYKIEDKFYTADRIDGGGIYATKFDNESGYSASHKDDTNFVSITAEVEKSVLADKFIDENGQEHTNTQTQNRILTIGEDFTTNVGTVAGAYAAKKSDGTAQDAIGGTVNISGSTDWNGTVYAGYSEKGEVNNNTITVASGTKAENLILSGSNKEASSASGNTLNIAGNGSKFNGIENFDTINFKDIALNTNAILTLNSANLTGTTLNVTSLAGSNNNYDVGDTVTLIKSENAITGTSD